jgi:hypothetical protein
MTAFRLISIPMNGAFELVAGLALAGLAVALGTPVEGAIAAAIAGAIMVGMAFAKAVESVPVRTQYDYDWGLAFALVGSAILLGLAGQPLAMLLFGVTALAQLALNLVTRYSASR